MSFINVVEAQKSRQLLLIGGVGVDWMEFFQNISHSSFSGVNCIIYIIHFTYLSKEYSSAEGISKQRDSK